MSTGLMQHPTRIGQPLDYAIPGGGSTRGFWTKRKRTAMSLLAIMALVAGIALAFKLFEQEVPNNVVRDASNFTFEIEARDVTAGEPSFRPAPGTTVNDGVFRQDLVACPPVGACDVNLYPGDSRTSHVRITNTNDPARDASFQTWVTAIRVFSYTGPADGTGTYSDVTGSPAANQFLGFWRMEVRKQTYEDDVTGFDCNDDGDCVENTSESSYATACGPSALTSLTRTAPCSLGIIRAAGTTTDHTVSIPPQGNADTDDREYRFIMSETDTGTDQSAFKGWRIIFTLNFAARVPAAPEGSSRYDGTAPLGIVNPVT